MSPRVARSISTEPPTLPTSTTPTSRWSALPPMLRIWTARPTRTTPLTNPMPTLDVLAIAAHRDDVEQTCGGTLLRMKALGLRTGILDLTQGEAGTRGSAAERAAEAAEAARILHA